MPDARSSHTGCRRPFCNAPRPSGAVHPRCWWSSLSSMCSVCSQRQRFYTGQKQFTSTSQMPAACACNMQQIRIIFHGSKLNSLFTSAIHCNNNNTDSAQCHRTQRAIANKGQFFAIFTRLLKNAPRCLVQIAR